MSEILDTEDRSELLFLRALIDNVDSAIMSVLFHRAQLINFVITYKKLHKMDTSRSKVREEIVKNTIEFATTLNLRKEFMLKILEHLFEASDYLYKHKIPKGVEMFLASDKSGLQQFNSSLNNLDKAFCSLLAERMQLVRQVGAFKKKHGIAPLSKERWEAVLKAKIELAKSLGINPDAVRELYTIIHEEALEIESSDGKL